MIYIKILILIYKSLQFSLIFLLLSPYKSWQSSLHCYKTPHSSWQFDLLTKIVSKSKDIKLKKDKEDKIIITTLEVDAEGYKTCDLNCTMNKSRQISAADLIVCKYGIRWNVMRRWDLIVCHGVKKKRISWSVMIMVEDLIKYYKKNKGLDEVLW